VENELSATDLRKQMQVIRQGLRPEVDEMVENARTLLTWQHYVKSYPWASMGVAAAVGFIAVPQKLKISSPDVETLKQLARENRLVVENKPKSQAKPGLIASALTLAGGAILRAALTYAGQHAGRFLEPGRTRQQTRSENDRLPATGGPSPQGKRF
jgi:hypothetical protein